MSTVLPYLTPKRNNPVLKHEDMEELSGITMTRLSCSVHDDRYVVMSKDNHMEANRLTVELLEALLQLRCMASGNEECIFTIATGRQMWW